MRSRLIRVPTLLPTLLIAMPHGPAVAQVAPSTSVVPNAALPVRTARPLVLTPSKAQTVAPQPSPSGDIPPTGAQALLPSKAAPLEKYKEGNVIIAFEGGVVGEDIGAVLLGLARNGNLLQTTAHIVAPGDSPCALMIGNGFPRPCGKAMLETLDILNPAIRPSLGVLKVGQTLLLPDVWLRNYKTARTLSKSAEADRMRSAAIKQNWAQLKPDVAQSTERHEQIEFDAYELILQTRDESSQTRLLARLDPYKSLNVRITPIGFAPRKAQAYGWYDPNKYSRECAETPPRIPRKLNYSSYADPDLDLTAEIERLPPRVTTRVYLLDVKLFETPNLAGAIEGGASAPPPPADTWRCAWTGEGSRKQHATHLAGIIASRDNGFGFEGLAPKAKIVPFELLEPSSGAETTSLDIPPGREAQFAGEMNEQRAAEDPLLYLVAADFGKYPPSLLNAANQVSANNRFDGARPIEANILHYRPLFIVAAGQSATPIALAPTVPMSPQNLGDLSNVLVVTACEDCSRNTPTLMAEANYGLEGKYVQVAAPGGRPMVGWLDGNGIGQAHGTSQAAAFAAGVAAEMMARWPARYRDADLLKRRIQVTSWPMVARPGNNDAAKIATGIVDPLLALVNPDLNWIKDGSGWKSMKLSGFSVSGVSVKTIDFTEQNDRPQPISGKDVARIVRINDVEPAQWVVYKRGGEDGEIERYGPLTAPEGLGIVACGNPGAVTPLSNIRDLVVRNTMLASSSSCAP